MIAPRLPVSYRDRQYAITQVGEAWCVEIGGAQYFLTAGTDPVLTARRFIRERMRNVSEDETRHPSLIASPHHPLVLSIESIIVRAWPELVPRDRAGWSKTYRDPRTGDRVLAVEGPVWMFAAPGRESSACGTTNYQQTIDDIVDLAKIWLRSERG